MCVLVHPAGRHMCAGSVPVFRIHTCTQPNACTQGPEEAGRWAVGSDCWLQQSLYGTKAAQSSPFLLVPLAQPPLWLGRGRGLSLEALMTIRTAMPRDGEPEHGGLTLQHMSSYSGSPHQLSIWAVIRSPRLHFPSGMLPSCLCPWSDLRSASAVPVRSFVVPHCHLFSSFNPTSRLCVLPFPSVPRHSSATFYPCQLIAFLSQPTLCPI